MVVMVAMSSPGTQQMRARRGPAREDLRYYIAEVALLTLILFSIIISVMLLVYATALIDPLEPSMRTELKTISLDEMAVSGRPKING